MARKWSTKVQSLALSLMMTALTTVGACSSQQASSEVVYFAVEMASPQEAELAEDALYEISRKAHHNQFLIIDLVKSKELNNILSSQPTRRSVQDVLPQLETAPVDDQAKIKIFQRVLDLIRQHKGKRPLYVYVLTAGTQDTKTLSAIQSVCEEIAKQKADVNIYVIGLAKEHRLKMSPSVSPLGDRVRFAGSQDSEWLPLLKKF